jgi:hypothetical protein
MAPERKPHVTRLKYALDVQHSPTWTIIERHLMSEKKPTPILAKRNSKICPVCGKRSYSAAGVHPQCAMVQSDAPRKLRLAAEKKAKALERQQTLEKPV